MSDPLKTFLERARDGGLSEFQFKAYQVHHKNVTRAGMGSDALDAFVLFLIFNTEAAIAVWGEESITYNGDPGWMEKQSNILSHLQNGDTPLEALTKQL